MEERRIFTLTQVGIAVQHQIAEATGGQAYWIKAEIAQFKVKNHAYLELVEHKEGQKVAVMRANIWNSNYQRIRQELGREAGNILKDGVEVLLLGRVQYHLVYGLSINIEAIDLSFNIGELERRKLATIKTLKEEGLYNRNRFTPMPMVLQRIALVASAGSAAYADFMQHLERNEQGYRFHVRVFNSAVQGDAAAAELRAAVQAIDPRQFDALVLIRGGGSKLDLEPFNDLELARSVAVFPKPVLTGIGHDVDTSVIDLIAKEPHKTPTAVADFLVDKSSGYEIALTAMLDKVHNLVLDDFTERREVLSAYAEKVRTRPGNFCQLQRGQLHNNASQLAHRVQQKLKQDGQALEMYRSRIAADPVKWLRQVQRAALEELSHKLMLLAQGRMQAVAMQLKGLQDAVNLLGPEATLARGFSITRCGGRAVLDAANLRPGDCLATTLAKGTVHSTIDSIDRHG